MVEIKHCLTDSDFSFVMQITTDYIRWLNMDLSFQDIDKELSNFPLMYGPPNGLFLLAWHRGELGGGVGLRMFEANPCTRTGIPLCTIPADDGHVRQKYFGIGSHR